MVYPQFCIIISILFYNIVIAVLIVWYCRRKNWARKNEQGQVNEAENTGHEECDQSTRNNNASSEPTSKTGTLCMRV